MNKVNGSWRGKGRKKNEREQEQEAHQESRVRGVQVVSRALSELIGFRFPMIALISGPTQFPREALIL